MFRGYLPQDILLQITQQLYNELEASDPCDLPWRERPRREVFTPRFPDSLGTLSHLSQASKTLNELVRPYLYHNIKLRNGNAHSFIKTILSSLELRLLVRTLSLEFTLSEDEGDYQPIVEFELGWSYEECLSRSLEAVGLDVSVLDAAHGHADRICVPVDTLAPEFDERENEDVSSVLLFLLPSLKRLRLAFEESWYIPQVGSPEGIYRCEILLQTITFPHRAAVAGSSLKQRIPAALQNLRVLQVYDPFQQPGSVKSNYPPIQFHEVGEVLPLLLLPSLDSLMLETVESSDYAWPLVKSQATDLRLSNCRIGAAALPKFLRCFDTLSSITYETIDNFAWTHPEEGEMLNADHLSPRLLINAMEAHRSTLESITFRSVQRDHFERLMGHCDPHWDPPSRDPRHRRAREFEEGWIVFRRWLHSICGTVDLRPFTSLRSASFHSTDLVGWPADPKIMQQPTIPRISEVIPPSLERLTLRYDHLRPNDVHVRNDNMFDHIEHLMLDVGEARTGQRPVMTKEGNGFPELYKLHTLILDVTDHWKGNIEDRLEALKRLGDGLNIKVTWDWHKHPD